MTAFSCLFRVLITHARSDKLRFPCCFFSCRVENCSNCLKAKSNFRASVLESVDQSSISGFQFLDDASRITFFPFPPMDVKVFFLSFHSKNGGNLQNVSICISSQNN